MDEKLNDIISEEISKDSEEDINVLIELDVSEESNDAILEQPIVDEKTEQEIDQIDDVSLQSEIMIEEDDKKVSEPNSVRTHKTHFKKDEDEIPAGRLFLESFLTRNTVLTQAVGLCPLLALSVSVKNGLFISMIATIVLVISNVLISLLGKIINERIRIPVFLMITTGIVTVLNMLLEAFVPDISMSLGLYIPLIAVDSIILLRADGYARNHSFVFSAIDGFATGLGFTLIMFIMSVIRELLGSGSFFGISILPESFPYFTFILLPFGGFLVLGLLIALYNKIFGKK